MRVPSSLLVGLMWFDPDLPNAPAALRHNAEDRDGEYRGEERVKLDECLQAGLDAHCHCPCFSRCASHVLQFDLTDLQVIATDVSSISIAALHQPLVCSCPISFSEARMPHHQSRSPFSICLTQHTQRAGR